MSIPPELVVAGGDALGHAHTPGIEHEFLHLGLVDSREPYVHPVVSQVGLARHEELVRLGGDQGSALVLREAESHDRLVPRKSQEHDPADPELDPVPDQRFVGARQRESERTHIVDGDHAASLSRGTDNSPARSDGSRCLRADRASQQDRGDEAGRPEEGDDQHNGVPEGRDWVGADVRQDGH